MKQQVTLTIEKRLIEKIDQDRGRVPRSAAIEELILNSYHEENHAKTSRK